MARSLPHSTVGACNLTEKDVRQDGLLRQLEHTEASFAYVNNANFVVQ